MQIARSKRGTTIYRRHKTWVYRAMVKYIQYYFPLSSLKAEALARADEIKAFLTFNTIDAAMAHYNARKVLRDNPVAPAAPARKVPTVGELLDLFDANTGALDVTGGTAIQYRSGLRTFAMAIQNNPALDPRTLSTSAITAAAWDRYRSDEAAKRPDEAAKLTCKITLNSKLRSIRSIVQPEAMRMYEAQKPDWNFDALKKFYDEATFFKKATKKYRLPTDEVIHRAFEAIENLVATDPAAGVVGLLAVHAGLRAEEITECRWYWFDERTNWNRIYVEADQNFKPKGTSDFTEINPVVTARIKSLLPKGTTDYLLGDKKVLRESAIERARAALAPVWLEKKQLHELRKLFGSFIASTRGLFVAQKLLRHGSADTTSDNYADVVVGQELLSYWLQSAPTPQVPPPSKSPVAPA